MSKLSPALKKITRRNKTPVYLTGKRQPTEESIRLDEKRKKAYAMLLEDGRSITEIAKHFEISVGHCHGWLNHEYEKTKAANSHSAALVREQSSTQLDKIIERWMPLALHEDLKVQGEKYGANGELKHIEIEAWEAGLKAADLVLKAVERKTRLYGLDKIALDLPKGSDVHFHNATAIFQIVRQAADRLKDEPKQAQVIEAEIIP